MGGARARPRVRLAHAVAGSMGVPIAALPVLDELFASCRSLGTPPARVARWLRDAGVSSRHAVLDLGCGKGAASVAIAAACAARVVGLDAHTPFIESARAYAARRGLAARCRFAVADVFDATSRGRAIRRVPPPTPGSRGRPGPTRFDAAVMLNVAGLETTLPLLRSVVKRGGLYVVDDAVVDRSPGGLTLAAARRLIECRADRIVREHRWAPAELRRLHRTIGRRLAARAMALAQREPSWRAVVAECLCRHAEAAAALRDDMRPVLWMVRRG